MTDERVKQAVRERSAEGRLACKDALQIAEELDVKPIVVGRAANELGIKLVNCQLGCFGQKKAERTG